MSYITFASLPSYRFLLFDTLEELYGGIALFMGSDRVCALGSAIARLVPTHKPNGDVALGVTAYPLPWTPEAEGAADEPLFDPFPVAGDPIYDAHCIVKHILDAGGFAFIETAIQETLLAHAVRRIVGDLARGMSELFLGDGFVNYTEDDYYGEVERHVRQSAQFLMLKDTGGTCFDVKWELARCVTKCMSFDGPKNRLSVRVESATLPDGTVVPFRYAAADVRDLSDVDEFVYDLARGGGVAQALYYALTGEVLS